MPIARKRNTDLMNKGLKLPQKGFFDFLNVAKRNTDLMNKGLKQGRTFRRYLISEGMKRNTDLMNKGLKLFRGQYTCLSSHPGKETLT